MSKDGIKHNIEEALTPLDIGIDDEVINELQKARALAQENLDATLLQEEDIDVNATMLHLGFLELYGPVQ